MTLPPTGVEEVANEEPQDEIPSIPSITSITLDLPPSCIEFSPSHPELFIVGTYELNESSTANHESVDAEPVAQNRHGSLILFSLKEDVNLLQTLHIPCGILDLHFQPSDPAKFATATSAGAICLCSLHTGQSPQIAINRTLQIFAPNLLSLSLAWHPHPNFPSTIVTSCSNGSIAITNLSTSTTPTPLLAPAHTLEAWTLAWSNQAPNDPNPAVIREEIYSGGDDSILCRRIATLHPKESNTLYELSAIVPDRKTHSAGITAILPLQPNIGRELLLTGSYDEHVRLLLPQFQKSMVLAEKKLGGGVWRLKLVDVREREDPYGPCFMVLATCMHAGVRVLEIGAVNGGEWYIKVLARFEEHESMCYASDVRGGRSGGKVGGYTYVSTSFYDRRLCVWEMEGGWNG